MSSAETVLFCLFALRTWTVLDMVLLRCCASFDYHGSIMCNNSVLDMALLRCCASFGYHGSILCNYADATRSLGQCYDPFGVCQGP